MNSRIPISKIHPKENVGVALDNLSEGHTVEFDSSTFRLVDNIPLKHKFASIKFHQNDPDIAGATVLSLGCQHSEISIFKEALTDLQKGNEKPVLIYDQQTEGTVDSFLSKIIKSSFKEIQRTFETLSKLTIGLECGGSDSFSEITANPTQGEVSDITSDLGVITILAEFPEGAGVEQELVNRCATESLENTFLYLLKQYENATENWSKMILKK